MSPEKTIINFGMISNVERHVLLYSHLICSFELEQIVRMREIDVNHLMQNGLMKLMPNDFA